MNKIIEKLKFIMPSTRNKCLVTLFLYFSCVFLAFTQINAFNISNAWLTILACLGCGLLALIVLLGLIFSLPKFLNATINSAQYFVVFCIIFGVELLLFSVFSFIFMLISPIMFLIAGMIMFIAIAWFNILFEFKYLVPLIGNDIKILNTIKLYNILIVCIVLLLWFIF